MRKKFYPKISFSHDKNEVTEGITKVAALFEGLAKSGAKLRFNTPVKPEGGQDAK